MNSKFISKALVYTSIIMLLLAGFGVDGSWGSFVRGLILVILGYGLLNLGNLLNGPRFVEEDDLAYRRKRFFDDWQ